MIEIQCPRCEQYWYDNEEKEGRARLCSRCLDHLRYKRRQRGLIDIPFLLVAWVLFCIDLIWIALTVLKPALFAKVMCVYGGLLFSGGLIALRGIRFDKNEIIMIDWKFGRWPLLVSLSGMVCLLASLLWMKQ